MNKILEDAKKLEKTIVSDRRTLHEHPEVGFDLPDTVDFVQRRLSEMGIAHMLYGGPLSEEMKNDFMRAGLPKMDNCFGVVATIGHGSPCILLRADMDALPMPETSGLPYCSRDPNKAHMCGHDAHAAMLLGAARLLKDRENELKGTVKLMFQPGEECGCGSRFMVEDGVLERPTVDAAFMMHVMPTEKLGTVSYSEGIMSAALDTFVIDIQGKGGHSSEPHKTIDPLMISNQLYTALNMLSLRECDPKETIAFTVGTQNGGTAINVIPDTAKLGCSFRSFNREARSHLLKRIPEIVDHTVKMWRGEYHLTEFHTPSTYTEPAVIAEMKPSIAKIVGEENIRVVPAFTSTEDFGYISEQVPSMGIWLGAGDESYVPLHNPAMQLDERVLVLGAAIHTQVAMDWLQSHQ